MKALIAVLAVAGCALAVSASATPPGKNGRIAFTRYVDETRSSGSIYVIAANGKGERRVTRAPAGARDTQPDWSPDGSRIVFERQNEDAPWDIFTVRPDGSDLTQLEPACPADIPQDQVCGEEGNPAWSPDGKRIAFAYAYGKLKFISGEEWIEVGSIAVMNPDGSGVRQLTQLKRPTSSEDSQAVWSPNGKQIAFVRLNSTAKPRNGQAIFVMNADGTRVRQVTPWHMQAGDHPDWSPDGTWILFRSPEPDGLAGTDLYRVHPDGTGLRALTNTKPDVEMLSASYSPDGRSIVFARTGMGGLPDLYVMRADGSGSRPLTRTAKWDSAADWGPRR